MGEMWDEFQRNRILDQAVRETTNRADRATLLIDVPSFIEFPMGAWIWRTTDRIKERFEVLCRTDPRWRG
jgi:hypothetical protein